jgi:hypothetical protein
MRDRLPGEDPDSLYVQPSLIAGHGKAFVAYHQRRQVRRLYRDAASF